MKEGDIVSCDIGTLYKGYNGDSCYTFPVGEIDAETRKLLDVTKASLYKGIEAAIDGNRTGDIGYAVQSYAESFGFSVVRELEGHGIGKGMHEAPGIPNYGRRGHGARLVDGMTICIEPMINAGKKDVYLARNGWAVHTADTRTRHITSLRLLSEKAKRNYFRPLTLSRKTETLNFKVVF